MTLRRWITAGVVMVGATVALMLFGLEPLFALSGGVLAGAVVLLAVLRGAEAVIEDGPRHEQSPATRGSEISRLAWAFNPRTGVAGEIVSRRVRALLRRRLARRGLDVDDPAQAARIDGLLGVGLWQRLSSRQVQNADIRSALDAADRLVTASEAPHEPTTQPPTRKQERA
ncbi:hypothetical protein M2317_003411 [Microbacterium sp. ZKA21]|uniref:hypothetical protein n=1 Tax=Microbacterium sp. ZKA21 TaxID=3381694 RepID=UPI003D22E952